MIDYSLYLCTNSEINNHYTIDECVKQAIEGGVTIVQVREKNKSLKDDTERSARLYICCSGALHNYLRCRNFCMHSAGEFCSPADFLF